MNQTEKLTHCWHEHDYGKRVCCWCGTPYYMFEDISNKHGPHLVGSAHRTVVNASKPCSQRPTEPAP